MSRRPSELLVVAGTGTEVGKTWVAARLAEMLRARGVSVSARKPAQSYEADDDLDGTDAALLGAATGEAPTDVCAPQHWYPVAMAPPMAADALGRAALRVDGLVSDIVGSWPSEPIDVGMVELAGGVWSPIAHDGDGLDLTRALAPDRILLVADAGLGTLNAVRPALAALGAIAPVVVLLNRFDATAHLHRRNLAWLRERDGATVATAVAELADTLVAV
ncbi:MAG: ATP-dependent dethiobiotin synthetase BioD [Microthrixaceae bacterium]